MSRALTSTLLFALLLATSLEGSAKNKWLSKMAEQPADGANGAEAASDPCIALEGLATLPRDDTQKLGVIESQSGHEATGFTQRDSQVQSAEQQPCATHPSNPPDLKGRSQ